MQLKLKLLLPSRHKTLNECRFNVGPLSTTILVTFRFTRINKLIKESSNVSIIMVLYYNRTIVRSLSTFKLYA